MSQLVAPVVNAPPLERFAPPDLVVATSPAAGANFTQIVDDGHWWRLNTLFVRIVTDGTAANRSVRVEYLTEADNVYHVNGNPVTYPASSTEDYSFSIFHPRGEWEVGATTNLVPLAPLLLAPSHKFRILVNNIQATDQLSRIRYTVERFYPPKSSAFEWQP